MIVEDITLVNCIGKGSFGEVYFTKKRGVNKVFATKKVPKSLVMQEKVKRYFNNELFILKNVEHPNIIKLHDIKQTINNFYLVFDFCNGGGLSNCLQAYMSKYKKPFSEEIVQYIMKQIVSGLRYLHKNKILHRDLKLDNILVHFPNEDDKKAQNMLKSEIKIIDFGFARYLQEDDLAYSILGSPIYMDPQILKKMKKLDNKESFGYDEKADIWSLGTICYELLIGTTPFDATSYDELLEKIQKGIYRVPNHLKLSKQSISFLNGLLQLDPKQRLGVDDIVYHEFLTVDSNNFESIDLNKVPKDYTNAKEMILSAKDNLGLWLLFETPGGDNLKDIPKDMYSDKGVQEVKIEEKVLKSNPEDIIGSMLQAVNNFTLENTGRARVPQQRAEIIHVANPSDDHQMIKEPSTKVVGIEKKKSGEQVVDEKKKGSDFANSKLVQDSFDLMNKDSYYLEPMLIPSCPTLSEKMKGIEL